MSEAGEATTTTTTTTAATALPQAPAEAAAAVPQDPAPKSPVGGGAPQAAAATAPAVLAAGNPGGDATPAPTGPAAPASSAPTGNEDAEKKVLGESVPGSVRAALGGAAEHVWASPSAFPTPPRRPPPPGEGTPCGVPRATCGGFRAGGPRAQVAAAAGPAGAPR